MVSQLNKKEVEYIKLYKSDNTIFGYNSTSGGNNMPKAASSSEAIEKIRKAALTRKDRGLTLKYENHPFAKHVCQYDLNKNLIKI